MAMKKFLNEYNQIGYFIQKNFIDQTFTNSLLKEVEKAKKLQNVDIYSDRGGLPRRIERLYDKGNYLKKLNLKISKLLEQVFSKSFLIFKDKFNYKPPGGEGYKAHFDGIFQFIDENNKVKNGWYEYGDVFVNVLISLDKADESNGTLQISEAIKDNFGK